MGRRAAIAGGVYVVALALFALLVALPFATKTRAIPAAVPSPPALRVLSFVPMRSGARTCMSDVAVTPQSRGVSFRVTSYGKRTPALRVSLAAGDDRTRRTVSGGYPDNASLSVPIPAPRTSRLATVCDEVSRRSFAQRRRQGRVRSRCRAKGAAATPPAPVRSAAAGVRPTPGPRACAGGHQFHR